MFYLVLVSLEIDKDRLSDLIEFLLRFLDALLRDLIFFCPNIMQNL